ncbi:MAG: rod-binding protein [Pelagimonas sp.]|jgi:Rod binding domain-containing protein|nr:rod-binding protein [Pelagimonas sp.]
MEISPDVRPMVAQSQDKTLRDAAQKLEATFLAEMFKAAGLGETPEGFGGGAGEEHFASFMRQAQAEQMAAKGGIGLAEAIFHSLKERAND